MLNNFFLYENSFILYKLYRYYGTYISTMTDIVDNRKFSGIKGTILQY